jgi:hypothetical protein
VQRKVFYRVRMSVYLIMLFAAMLGALYALPASTRYRVTEQYQFVSATESGDVALGILAPQSGPYQRVSAIDIDWHSDIARERAPGLDILMLSGTLPAGTPKTATVDLRSGLAAGQNALGRAGGSAPPFPTGKNRERRRAHCSVGGVVERAQRGDAPGRLRHLQFRRGYLAWPTEERINVSPTAMDALVSKVGVCEDFANLMVALCRATGAPAQVISGLYFPETLLPFVVYTRRGTIPRARTLGWSFILRRDGKWPIPVTPRRFLPLRWRAFGRNDGRHLSYGEAHAELEIYAQMQAWALSMARWSRVCRLRSSSWRRRAPPM